MNGRMQPYFELLGAIKKQALVDYMTGCKEEIKTGRKCKTYNYLSAIWFYTTIVGQPSILKRIRELLEDQYRRNGNFRLEKYYDRRLGRFVEHK